MFTVLENRIPPPVIGIICLAFVWAIARYCPGPIFEHTVINIMAGVLAALGLAFDVVSLGAFRKADTTFNPLSPDRASALVTSGLYQISRNPMYLGMLLILTAWTLHQGHPAGLIPLAGFVLYMNRFQIIPEEKAMINNFEDDYRDYMKHVRRWI